MPLQLSFKALVLFLVGVAYSATPYYDAVCTNEITNYTYDTSGLGNGFKILSGGITDSLDPATWWDDVDFSGAELDGSSYIVYWKFDLDTTCRAALLAEYSQGSYGSVDGDSPPGNVFLNAGSSTECYYSTIKKGTSLGGTFCCGTGDCSLLDLGDDGLGNADSKREIKTMEEVKERQAISPAAHASHMVKRASYSDWSDCEAIDISDSWTEAGLQVAVTPEQGPCEKESCELDASLSVTSGTTVTSSTDQTIENGYEVSTSVTAGENLLIESVEVTAEFSYSFAKSVTTSKGLEVENSTTYSVSNTLYHPQGTTAFMSFTPTYSCYQAKMKCGDSTSDWLNLCQPLKLDSGSLEGQYLVVYI